MRIQIVRLAALISALSVVGALSSQPAEASRAFARGPNGAVGAFASRNQYGGRAGARFLGPNAGAGIRGGNYTGPNGGHVQGGAGFGYKKGLGAFRNSGWSGNTASGASGSGYTHNVWNAQTGQGTRNSSEQFTSASGQTHGINDTTSYTKTSADSVVNTDHNGSYDVDWSKGSKPTITPVPNQ